MSGEAAARWPALEKALLSGVFGRGKEEGPDAMRFAGIREFGVDVGLCVLETVVERGREDNGCALDVGGETREEEEEA